MSMTVGCVNVLNVRELVVGCVNSEYVAIVRNWLDSLPEGLGDIAYDWAMSHVNGHRGAPRPIIRKLKKHIPALLEQLGSHFPDEFNAEKEAAELDLTQAS